ncbi:MAG: molybdopterin-binding/glycosyltransferase family 2 protein [Alphaproteobacteria bacterium]|nr:molybdopterin-binding/glycosyltransferase family 2 protein [Alphaproteobacteria bacterium]
MQFGHIPLSEAEGIVLAHSVRVAGGPSFKKGRVLSAEDVEALRQAGVAEVIGAKLTDKDVGEDRAADRLAAAVAGSGVSARPAFTGRANLFADRAGLLGVSPEAVDRFNRVDEAITLATLDKLASVEEGQMVGTLKIIPLSAAQSDVERAETIARKNSGLLKIHPYRPRTVGLVQTRLPATKESVLDKTVEVTTSRLAQLSLSLTGERRTAHETAAVADAIRIQMSGGADVVLLFGASAIVDRRDVLPAAIEACGGEIEHFGMPVDPGNLILTGHIGDVPVIGMPGCARSPKLNGFDWVLARLAADLPIGRAEITGMGVGGLLKEIETRPSPRSGKAAATGRSRPKIAGLILAGGSSKRMGEANKLTLDIGGKPLVRRIAEACGDAALSRVMVATGHQPEAVRSALSGLDVGYVHAPDHEEGLAATLRTGIAALLSDDIEGVVVCLGDMPDITGQTIDRLIAAFDPLEGRSICIPTHHGKRGNPVLIGRAYLQALTRLTGDSGARHIIAANPDAVAEVEMPEPGILIDLDTQEAVTAYQKGDSAKPCG